MAAKHGGELYAAWALDAEGVDVLVCGHWHPSLVNTPCSRVREALLSWMTTLYKLGAFPRLEYHRIDMGE